MKSAAASASAADVSGEWLFKGSAFGSRLPLPPETTGATSPLPPP